MPNHQDTFKLVVAKRTPRLGTNKTIKVPVTCKHRAKLYESQLVRAQHDFRDMTDPNMAPPTPVGHLSMVDRRLWYALTGRRLKRLLECLAEILDDYVAWGVYHDIRAANAAGNPYANSSAYSRQRIDVANGVNNFYANYPLLNHAIPTLRGYFVENIRLACERITTDWDEIENAFFDTANGETIDSLYEITPTGSDFHKGGKQVLILTFAYTPGPNGPRPLEKRAGYWRRKAVARRSENTLNTAGYLRKVVYKPTDVEIDYRIMGNTARVHAARPAHPEIPPQDGTGDQMSLMELMNDILNLTGTAEELPTYTILPYNPGSSIAANPPGVAIRNSYGYLEFLTNEPAIRNETRADPLPDASVQVRRKCDAIQRAGHTWRGLVHPNPPILDYVTDQGAVVDTCFRTWGRLTAIALVCSITDMHVQNVIIHKCKPHFIDLEDSFKWRMTGVKGTGIFGDNVASCDNYRYPNTIFNAKNMTEGPLALGCGVWVGPPEYSGCVLYRYNNGGQPVRQTRTANIQEIRNGFDEAIDALGAGGAAPLPNARLRNWVATNLANTITRFVAMPTRHYYDQLSDYVRNCADHAPLNPHAPLHFRNAFLNKDFLFEKAIKNARYALFGPKQQPPTAAAITTAAAVGGVPAIPPPGAVPAGSAWPAAELAIDREKWQTTCLPIHVLEYPDYNWLDTVHYDIGSFNRRLSSQQLLNSEGTAVDIHAAWTWQNARLADWVAAPGNQPVAQINAVMWNEQHPPAWGALGHAGVGNLFFPETAIAVVTRQIQYLTSVVYRNLVKLAAHQVIQ
jgi:hypothetical protein